MPGICGGRDAEGEHAPTAMYLCRADAEGYFGSSCQVYMGGPLGGILGFQLPGIYWWASG